MSHPTGSPSFVAATFNVRTGYALDGRHSWPLRRRAATAAIRRLGADVVGLQEARRFQVRALARVPPRYRVAGEGRSGGRRGEHCPVLFRPERYEVLDERTEWYGGVRGGRLPGASFPRIATIVHLRDREGGFDVEVVNTHLDEHRPENRATAARQLAGWITPGRPTVVMGDLNTTPGDESVFGVLAGAGLRPVHHGQGTTHQFTGRLDGPEIDHILITEELDAVEAAVVVTDRRPYPSDHWPLRAVLRAAGPDAGS